MGSNTIVCKGCGNEIEITDVEYNVIRLVGDIFESKNLSFNILAFTDKTAKCCKNPYYHFKDI